MGMMMRRYLGLSLLILGLILVGCFERPVAAAEQSASSQPSAPAASVTPDEQAIEALVRQLGDDDYQVRAGARKKLAEMVEAARPVLVRALQAKGLDPETIQSVRTILAQRQARLEAAAIADIQRLGAGYEPYNAANEPRAPITGVNFDLGLLTDEGMAHLPGLPHLQRLNLLATKITDGGMVYLQELPELTSLTLYATRITDAGLINLKGLTQLQMLALGKTKVTDAGLVQLAELKKLRILDLDEVGVTDAGLAQLKGLRALQNLSLKHTQITDAGLAYLKELQGLRSLYLWRTNVTDAGLVQLKELHGLQLLDLGRTKVTDAGLAQLKDLKELQWLDLRGTQVTNVGKDQLQRALPNCRFAK
jgi:hypothetical protein